jgi:hypothetical protein
MGAEQRRQSLLTNASATILQGALSPIPDRPLNYARVDSPLLVSAIY